MNTRACIVCGTLALITGDSGSFVSCCEDQEIAANPPSRLLIFQGHDGAAFEEAWVRNLVLRVRRYVVAVVAWILRMSYST
jgi:hypothetical protein